MYRPQSQISRQRSNDIRDLQSKTKKLSNKQYKDYVKRLIENNTNHIDSERRLKIDTGYSNRNQLRERIEKKLGDDEKEMWRSGVVRFIKPRLSDREYKRFKKLFDIFNRIQKTKQEILSLTFSSTKFIKDSNALYQNERVKQLKESLLKLQLEQQKILLEIESQGKENKNQCFSLQKVVSSYKRGNDFIEKRLSGLERCGDCGVNNMGDGNNINGGSQSNILMGRNNKDCNESQNSCVQNKRIESQISNSNKISPSQRQNSSNQQLQEQNNYLVQLHDFLCNMDGKKLNRTSSISSSSKTKQVKDNNYVNSNTYTSQLRQVRIICEQIRQFMITKQKTIEQLFVNLSSINSINHFSSSNNNKDERVVTEAGGDKKYNDISQLGSQKQSVRSTHFNNNQFNKFHQIDRMMKQSIKQQQQKQQKQQKQHKQHKQQHFINNTNTNNNNEDKQQRHNQRQPLIINNNKRYNSFKSILKQLQQDLTEYKHMTNIKQRNNQLAKKLLLLNKQLQQTNQQKILLQKQINSMSNRRVEQCEFDQMKKENKQLVRINEELLREKQEMNKELQQCHQKIIQLQTKVEKIPQLQTKVLKYEQLLKQESNNYQKYYRQSLTLQQELKILSQQNQKLVNQLGQIKRLYERQKEKQKYLDSNNNNNNNNNNSHNNNNNSSHSHDKSIKPCTSTSLIYKQFQRKNKKLTQQNTKLSQINKLLHEKIKQLQQQLVKRIQINAKQTHNDNNKYIQQYQQELKKLKKQNKLIKEQIISIRQQNKSIKQQNQSIRQQNRFMQQQNKILLQQNNKIQQQFQYLVKQKLQIQSHVSDIEKLNMELNNRYKRIKQQSRQKLLEVYDSMVELKEQKRLLIKQMEGLKLLLKEMLMCLGQQVANALDIFVSGCCGEVNNIGDDKDNKDSGLNIQAKLQLQRQQDIATDSNQLNNNSQQEQQLTVNNNNKTINKTLILQQQYQALLNEFNHCLYQLSRYKQMFNQLQIQKQLQKKYYQEDIYKLKLQILKSDKQIIGLNHQLVIMINNGGGKKVRQLQQQKQKEQQGLILQTLTKEQYTQTITNYMVDYINERKLKLKINCESYSISIKEEIKNMKPQTQDTKAQIQDMKAQIQSSTQDMKAQIQYRESSTQYVKAQTVQQISNINSQQQRQTQCHQFDKVNSLTLHSKVLEFTKKLQQITKMSNENEQIKQVIGYGQDVITLDQWLKELQLGQSQQQQKQQEQQQQQQEQNSYKQFVNFCMINLSSKNDQSDIQVIRNQSNIQLIRNQSDIQLIRNTRKQQQQNNSNNNDNNQTTNMRQNKLKSTQSSQTLYNQHYYQQLSQNKNMRKNISTQQQQLNSNNNEKVGIFGSLYNKFSFPKLQPTQQTNKYEINRKVQQQQQKHQQSLINNINNNNINNINNNNLYSTTTTTIMMMMNNTTDPYQDEDQSFDLCII